MVVGIMTTTEVQSAEVVKVQVKKGINLKTHNTGGVSRRSTNEVELYPVLQDLNFQKVKDPYTAFQEVQAYKFGVLGCNENEVVTISDKDRIAGKGFDTKYGFRTRPHKGE